jgi:hypothetical protein
MMDPREKTSFERDIVRSPGLIHTGGRGVDELDHSFRGQIL